MGSRDHAIGRIILAQPGQQLGGARGGPPVAHQVADDGEQRDDVDDGARHAVVGDVPDQRRRRAGSLDVGLDGVAFGAEGERAKGSAFVSVTYNHQ